MKADEYRRTLTGVSLNLIVRDVTRSTRGFGVEIRLLGIDPDEAERRARAAGHTVFAPAQDWPPHGWRDCLIEDPDGGTFSVGTALPSARLAP